MAIARNITELVGNTPMVVLAGFAPEGGEILAKLESFNPCGSVKDRIALAMIEDAEKKGMVGLGSLIVEATSGNTGIGLAFVCAQRGYQLVLTMPASMSVERRNLLKLLGARLELTQPEKGMKGAIARAEEILKENKNAFMPWQFDNPANPEVHRRTTAEEIWRDTEGRVDILVAGVGTGGTLTGTGSRLKELNPKLQVVAVEPQASPVLSGGEPGPHRIQGIGAGFIPGVLDTEVIDQIVQVGNTEAMEAALELGRREGILAGISSGAAAHAARIVASRKENLNKRIVVILPDTGERYLSVWSSLES
ncbi:cysteine synthase A [Marispirochaeta aestuarii]|uniref:Cysteine synthase n=1 Tax=Marispirochaeta aestuarii TaxID=1963862 RepID=A0A1Y1RX87_9SPIO|nr:cysteine synthase A [Marispirochaeta aestuarii]ORC34900.1 cysteine synthase A [Marispirochaeta aestuarii]